MYDGLRELGIQMMSFYKEYAEANDAFEVLGQSMISYSDLGF